MAFDSVGLLQRLNDLSAEKLNNRKTCRLANWKVSTRHRLEFFLRSFLT